MFPDQLDMQARMIDLELEAGRIQRRREALRSGPTGRAPFKVGFRVPDWLKHAPFVLRASSR